MNQDEVLKLKATEERQEIARTTIARLALWVKERKLEQGLLTEDATAGFNLACDFLSHEMMKIQEFQNRGILK